MLLEPNEHQLLNKQRPRFEFGDHGVYSDQVEGSAQPRDSFQHGASLQETGRREGQQEEEVQTGRGHAQPIQPLPQVR